jgi:membrane fusion protein (multidrug efflux system)
MKLKIAIAVMIVLGVVGAVAGVKTLQIRKLTAAAKTMVQPPECVSTATAREEQWPTALTAIGSVNAVQGVTITPEIPGQVKEIAFQGGAVVAQGDLLVRLDVSSEQAQLRAVEAQAELARLNLVRERSLRSEKTVSQAELDAAEATLKQQEANADAIRTTIEKKTIRAPFAGRLGIRLVNFGQYLEAGKPIVSLQSLTPVFVDFALPQQELRELKTGMRVRVTTDTYGEQAFEGTLTAINPDLDASTRSVGLQATIQNPEQLLRPGMFVRAEVLLPQSENVLVIPATAVLSAPYGDSVYVVENQTSPNGKSELSVRQALIRVGRARGDFVSVQIGLKPGDRVVRAGGFKLRNGMKVVENNVLVPKTEVTPHPADS